MDSMGQQCRGPSRRWPRSFFKMSSFLECRQTVTNCDQPRDRFPVCALCAHGHAGEHLPPVPGTWTRSTHPHVVAPSPPQYIAHKLSLLHCMPHALGCDLTEAPSHCAVTVTLTVVRAHIGGGGGVGAGGSCPWGSSHAAGPWCTDGGGEKNSGDTISCFNMSSLRRGHADRLCNIPSFTCDTLLRGCAIMDIWWAYVKPVG